MRNSPLRVALGLVAICGVAALWIIPSYAQVPGTLERPGMAPARVWVNNKNLDEAIPVTLVGGNVRAPLPVTVHGTATVSGKVERARQIWEYRESSSAITALNALGNDGWEVVGVLQPGANPTVLLKRPR